MLDKIPIMDHLGNHKYKRSNKDQAQLLLNHPPIISYQAALRMTVKRIIITTQV
jgi:hypothetical protein